MHDVTSPTPSENPNSDANLSGLQQEYADVSNNIRHYSQLQFAQLTLCIAIIAGLLSILFGSSNVSNQFLRTSLEIAGILLASLFYFMSVRVQEYWDARVNRAKEIEVKIGFSQYSTTPPKKFLSNRLAVDLVYGLIALLFVICVIIECKTLTQKPSNMQTGTKQT